MNIWQSRRAFLVGAASLAACSGGRGRGANPSEAAEMPRWHRQKPFYEVWFFVFFHPTERRAWWLRFTTWAPKHGAPLAMQWLAASDASHPEPIIAKSIQPAKAFSAASDRFEVRIDRSRVAPGVLAGQLQANGHRFEYDLGFDPDTELTEREPGFLRGLPLPTTVRHTQYGVRVSGRVTLDGKTTQLDGAPGQGKHLWGRKRPERLSWIWCPDFAEDPNASLEATSVALHEDHGAPMTFVFAESENYTSPVPSLKQARRAKVRQTGDFELTFEDGPITARSWCDPKTLIGYRYRDPRGWEAFVAQSDLASCEARVNGRVLTNDRRSTIEFHRLEPLPGVRYVPWDGAG